jgi:hypothetical protein
MKLTFNNSYLLHLPVEILIHIFSQLPNLSDAIALAATNHRLRLVYTENSKSIFDTLLPKSFAFHQLARQLLIDGGGPASGEAVSLFDLATMFRNLKIIKAAMAEFELHMKDDIQSK